jgi:hypothetical protein
VAETLSPFAARVKPTVSRPLLILRDTAHIGPLCDGPFQATAKELAGAQLYRFGSDLPTRCVWTEAEGDGKQKQTGICGTVRYNPMFQHPSDWHNRTGVIRQAEEQGMGIILMQLVDQRGLSAPDGGGVSRYRRARSAPWRRSE